MTYEINKLYGLLTDGDRAVRNTTTSRKALSDKVKRLLEALIPVTLSANSKRGLAEFYIRLIFTDKNLSSALTKYDPINSYKLHTFYPDYEDQVDIQVIISAIKKLGLAGEEISFLPLDYILNALKTLLEYLNG